MKYINNLLIRLFFCILLVGLGPNLLYFFLLPITIYSSYFLLKLYNPIIFGNTIIINNIQLVFVQACVAASAYVLLSLLILLTKDINFKKTIKMFITGFVLLFLTNLIRIFILAVILLEFGITLFNNLHLFVWQVLSTIIVLLIWVFLIKYYNIREIPVYSDFKELKKILK